MVSFAFFPKKASFHYFCHMFSGKNFYFSSYFSITNDNSSPLLPIFPQNFHTFHTFSQKRHNFLHLFFHQNCNFEFFSTTVPDVFANFSIFSHNFHHFKPFFLRKSTSFRVFSPFSTSSTARATRSAAARCGGG